MLDRTLGRLRAPFTVVVLAAALLLGLYCTASSASTASDDILDLTAVLAADGANLGRQPLLPDRLQIAYGQSGAAVTSDPACPPEWGRRLGLYLWFTGLKGDIGPEGRQASIDVSFSDILDDLDFGIMLYYEAGRNRSGYFADLLFIDLGPDVRGYADFEQLMLEIGGIYRWGTPEQAWDLLYGARYVDLSATLDLDLFPRVKGSRDWFEPFVGTRYITQLSDKWSLSVRGNIGGFGAGSDLTWELRAMFLYTTGKNSWALGWRYMDIDYDRTDFGFDVKLNGPVLAYVWGF
jgi:hypothetical protein